MSGQLQRDGPRVASSAYSEGWNMQEVDGYNCTQGQPSQGSLLPQFSLSHHVSCMQMLIIPFIT